MPNAGAVAGEAEMAWVYVLRRVWLFRQGIAMARSSSTEASRELIPPLDLFLGFAFLGAWDERLVWRLYSTVP